MLKLNEQDSFAEGAERKCYIHPNNPKLCIKIKKPDCGADQNKLESFYFSILKFKNINSDNLLPKLYGAVTTNLGEGLVYELVLDSNGQRSQSVSDYIQQEVLSLEQAQNIVQGLFDELEINGILMDDKNPENILLRRNEKGEYMPILIDGFGAKKFSLKFLIGAFFTSYAKFKTRKRAKQLITKMRLELGG